MKNDLASSESFQNPPSTNVLKFAKYPILVFDILGMFALLELGLGLWLWLVLGLNRVPPF